MIRQHCAISRQPSRGRTHFHELTYLCTPSLQGVSCCCIRAFVPQRFMSADYDGSHAVNKVSGINILRIDASISFSSAVCHLITSVLRLLRRRCERSWRRNRRIFQEGARWRITSSAISNTCLVHTSKNRNSGHPHCLQPRFTTFLPARLVVRMM
jgi:hypothetical protein